MKIDIEKIKRQKPTKKLLEFGIINLDKPSGPTSFNVSDFVRKTLQSFGVRKTSHFGTLDPRVTGVLPIALNRACKLTGFFIGEDKEYVGIMRFHKEVSLERVRKVIKEKFMGKIIQLPPVKSRVKRQEREREIKKFEILEKEGKDFLFRTVVQGGTYIRKLIHDLGEALGVGAHMLELRRTRAGIFEEGDKKYPSVNLYDLEKAIKENKLKDLIIPGEIISELHPVVEIKKEFVERVLHGSPIHDKFLKNKRKIEKGKVISVFSDEGNGIFVGMFRVVNAINIFAKPEFVLQPLLREKG